MLENIANVSDYVRLLACDYTNGGVYADCDTWWVRTLAEANDQLGFGDHWFASQPAKRRSFGDRRYFILYSFKQGIRAYLMPPFYFSTAGGLLRRCIDDVDAKFVDPPRCPVGYNDLLDVICRRVLRDGYRSSIIETSAFCPAMPWTPLEELMHANGLATENTSFGHTQITKTDIISRRDVIGMIHFWQTSRFGVQAPRILKWETGSLFDLFASKVDDVRRTEDWRCPAGRCICGKRSVS